ncbi:exodeoxyribonuclease VII large subunit [Mycoplasma putrefaciens]|uniref:exodeoxyribonuclease VII large subunit n=1 Tax=Mycoplasma putrefaciens TaxID=2123 RepID=UPI003DA563AA
MEKILTVQELNQNIKYYLENIDYFKSIYVKGELSNLTINKSSGHVYFSIKDEKASVGCMIWKSNAHKLIQLNPKEGMQITCVGRITYYIVGGKISFEVKDVRIEGIGELQKIYEERFKKLKEAGWFDPSIKKRLPNVVENVGIVTADTGAAIHDLITTIHRRMPSINIYLFPSQVQGAQAQFDLAQKIKQANEFEVKLDVLIVGRGGGSYEDLWAFNELELLQSIKDSFIPIISAVGHEPDITLADYVADIRAATPTAAGELVSRDVVELKKQLSYISEKFHLLLKNKYNQQFEILKHAKLEQNNAIEAHISRKEILIEQAQFHLPQTIRTKIYKLFENLSYFRQFLFQNIQRTLNHQNIIIIDSVNTLTQKTINKIEKNENDFLFIKSNFRSLMLQKKSIEELWFESISNKFILLNPKKPLENGYSIVTNQKGQKITSYKDISVNEKLKIFLADAKLTTVVEEVEKNE